MTPPPGLSRDAESRRCLQILKVLVDASIAETKASLVIWKLRQYPAGVPRPRLEAAQKRMAELRRLIGARV